MRAVSRLITVLLVLLVPFWGLAFCYTQMRDIYEFLDDEFYRSARREVEEAAYEVRQIQHTDKNSADNTELTLAEYRLTALKDELRSLKVDQLSQRLSNRTTWETKLYQMDSPVSKIVFWLVDTTTVSMDYAVIIPPVMAGLVFYGLLFLFSRLQSTQYEMKT